MAEHIDNVTIHKKIYSKLIFFLGGVGGGGGGGGGSKTLMKSLKGFLRFGSKSHLPDFYQALLAQ